MELRADMMINRFRLVAPLGKGGQGSVWKARDTLAGDTLYALKIVEIGEVTLRSVERAYQESTILGKTSHPSLVNCREFWNESASSLAGLVFDLVPGETLADTMRDPRMTTRHQLAILEHLVSVLSYIHGKGIIHRDIKPSNVLLTHHFWAAPTHPENMKLVDFGIAADISRPRGITHPGTPVGTPRYMSPEALLPQLAVEMGKNDYGRDIFAFGVLAWELLTGTHPTALPDRSGSPYADIYQHILEGKMQWPCIGQVSSPWGEKLKECLSMHLAQRPASGVDLARSSRPATEPDPVPTQGRPSQPSVPGVTPAGHTAQQAYTSAYPPTAQARPSAAPPSSSPYAPPPQGSYTPPPPPSSTPPAAAPPPKSASWGLLWFGVFGGFALAVILFLYFGPWSIKKAESSDSPLPFPKPESPIAPGPQRESSVVACCKDHTSCQSGRVCQHIPCTELPERTWMLRLSGVAEREPSSGKLTGDLSGMYPSARVCMQVGTGSTVCAPMKNIASEGGDRINRLPVRTSDVEQGRIRFWIEQVGSYIMPPTNAWAMGKLSNVGLCIGVAFYPGVKASSTVRISGYLDD